MLPRADIVGTRPVASVEAAKPIIPIGDARQELSQRLNRIALGASFQAEILSRMNDGSFMVKVADTAVRMNLPAGAQVGETLDLTLIAKQPNPTFLLNARGGENTTSLSNTGRLVDAILHAAQNEGAPTAVVGKAPLASSPDIPPGQLAKAMKDTLTYSGVFYESHVGQWANGERPLLALMAEPQAKNSNLQLVTAALRAAAGAAGQHTVDNAEHATGGAPEINVGQLARLIADLHGQPDAARLLMNMLRATTHPNQSPTPANTEMAQASSAAATPAAAPAATVPGTPATEMSQAEVAPYSVPTTHDLAADSLTTTSQRPAAPRTATSPETMGSEAVRMISLQLNTLEQQRVVWQGELWPGQPIEWEISEDTPHSKGKGTAAEQTAWQSIVRFELPTLGKVAAAVRLTGDRLQIQVRAANETTASLLRAHGDVLTSALSAAGSPLELLTVKRDESI